MVQYSKFRDELKWYFDRDNEKKFREVTELLTGQRDDFDNIVEKMEQKFPNQHNRVRELVGMASFVDREVRHYKAEGMDTEETMMAIYKPEGVKSKIIVSDSLVFGRSLVGSHLYSVDPTQKDVEERVQEILYTDEHDYERVK